MEGDTSPAKTGHKGLPRSPKRSVRCSDLPRSRTTGTFSPEWAGNNDEPTVENAAAREAGTSIMNFYPPTAGIPTDFKVPPASSTSTLDSAQATASKGKGKKKAKFFGNLRSTKDRSGSVTSIEAPRDFNTAPDDTPDKAMKVLGLNAGASSASASSVNSDGGQNQESGFRSGAPVRSALRKQASLPLLTWFKGFAKSKSTKLRKEKPKSDQPKFGETPYESGNKKASKRLGLSSSSSLGLIGGDLQGHAINLPSSSRSNGSNMAYTHNENESQHRLDRVPAASRPIPERRKRKKGPKSLERMSPITETSHGDLNTAYRNSEHATELDVISEYEYGYTLPGASVPPWSLTESRLTTGHRYDSTDGGRSLADLAIGENDEEPNQPHPGVRVNFNYENEPTDPHPGVRVMINEEKWRSPADILRRGPLSSLEHQLLDVSEERLQAHIHAIEKFKADNADNAGTDARVSQLKESHERMRNEFTMLSREQIRNDSMWNERTIKEPMRKEPTRDESMSHASMNERSRNEIMMLSPPPRNPRRLQQACIKAEETETDDDDGVSICSSIDTDEEGSIHEAELKFCTRVLPGTAKLVDILPRRNKAGPAIPSIVRVPPTPRITGPKFCIDCNEKIEVHNKKTENFEVSPAHPVPWHTLTRKQPMLPSKLFEATPYEQFTRPDKTRMSPEESRKYTQQWLSASSDPSEQQSASDPVLGPVLSSRQNPPTPPPKDGSATTKNTGKHSCLKNGHLFYPIDIAAVANRVSLNALGVRPYLMTPSGHRQAVQVPVKCDKCDKDTVGLPWECGIPVCRLTVCGDCARDMDEEWQERVVGEWMD